jgi:hypothetical protein
VIKRQYRVNRGGLFQFSRLKNAPDPYPNGLASKVDQITFYNPAWKPLPLNLVYLDKFITLAGSRGIRVFFLLPPIHPGIQAQQERLGFEDEYLKLIRKIHVRYANVTVIDGRHAAYPYWSFADAHHLTRDGAKAFSMALGESIAAMLDQPASALRWAVLPRYKDLQLQLVIEDLNESRAAIQGSLFLR